MKCGYCGHDIPEGKLYCDKCGNEVCIVPDYNPLEDMLTQQIRGAINGDGYEDYLEYDPGNNVDQGRRGVSRSTSRDVRGNTGGTGRSTSRDVRGNAAGAGWSTSRDVRGNTTGAGRSTSRDVRGNTAGAGRSTSRDVR